ncbi:ATP-binding protein [Neorhizobium alkalisoli]|uniref:Putative ATPase n=1 Tax=Neorhizobium alkalisoli TaxID=528178 RepID=A0A561Q7T9_9HYPH|nr:winged helix-turn-helix domain-containing protein [Neorhizobium alkalisoli]TWF46456.1 putative ATPase [Neorhizobium alkalisoli]
MGGIRRSGVFAFGSYRLHPIARTLTRNDQIVAVGSRAFDMLVALVERQGEVLSRRELMALAWPGLNVEDSNVRVQMAHLRRELRDGENDERYIVSVAGRGYCFVADAEWQDLAQTIEPDSSAFVFQGNNPSKGSLPARLDDAFGREENLASLLQMVEDRRFVTVIGAGGVGKTTLVILAAHALENFETIAFVDLSSADDGATVLEEIAARLGLSAEQNALNTVLAFLSHHRSLLILDNCEHVIDDAADVIGKILRQTSAVHVLATSREAFRLPGEAVYILRPLGVPPQTGRLTARQAMVWPSVQLFMQRSMDGGCHHPLDDDRASIVAAICRRLDGNPLAIELAASRIGSYGLDRVLELLDNQLALSWRGSRYAHPRHRTVQAMLDWSYGGLSEMDRMALRRLSIFSGEFSITAALAVLGGDDAEDGEIVGAIGNLVDKSLLVLQPGVGPAQLRLSGMTRTYAAIKLAECGEHSLMHQRLVALELLPEVKCRPDRPLVFASQTVADS